MLEPLNLDDLSLDLLSNQPTEETSLAEGFLKNIPDEQHRAIIAPYVKDWDGQVTKKFQEIHETYKPYKNLGSVEEIQSGLELITTINEDPLAFYSNLYDFLVEEGLLNVSNDTNEEVDEEIPVGVPKEFMEEFKAMKSKLDTFETSFTEKNQREEEAANQAELDKYVKAMHDEHGDFDDDYFVAKLARGVKPEDAIASFKKLTEGNGRTPKPPAKVFTGPSGSHPQEQAKTTFKNDSERKKFVLDALLAANADDE